jgi:F-type H+-transporting ATPase subunit a
MLASIAIALGVLLAQADARERLPAEGLHQRGVLRDGTARQEVGEVAEEAATPAEHIFHHVQDEPNWVAIPLNVNVAGHELNLNIGKHTVSMWIASLIMLITFAFAVRKKALVPSGLYSALESFVVFIRDDIAVQNIGHDGVRYTPYLCTAFFFILFINLFGLIPVPGIGTATGNLSVTVVLAIFTFLMTQLAGMRAQGAVGYWMHLVPAGVPKWLYPIMVPVELLGLFTKPFALTVRLFANMLAGHIVIYFLLGLTVMLSGGIVAHALGISLIAVPFALAIYMLELFVALVQAYVFTMLSAVFIGLASHSH